MNASDIALLEIRCLFHDRPLTLADQIVQGDAFGIKHEVYRFKGTCGCRVTFEKGAGPPTDPVYEKQMQGALKLLQHAQLELRKEN